ncbi:MAG: nitrite/sulfite reductase [Gammaproteobacteria bacterium]|jgi:sulfite reductase beta subunit-like hemoprotein|nr:nitrite/sulfite reductase [Gammaproteobacteria bacterium]
MSEVRSLVDHEELERFEESVNAFLRNEIDAERFQSIRLQQGIYGQRQEGVHMLRVKIPGGHLTPAQLEAIAEVLDKHAEAEHAHITTRQDIQMHYVPLAQVPTALRELARAGLTTREACNNTVRNVSCCPLAGACPSERVDIRLHQDHVMRYLLRHPLTQHLPRKFKISFSACESDCAQGMIHDLAVIAVKKDDRYGFKLLAGGGLGHKPRKAIIIEEFITEEELVPCVEAVISLHNRYSDRKRRAKSRIKFLVDRFGEDGFVEKYREELERTRTALRGHAHPRGEWRDGTPSPVHTNPGAPRRVLAQKQPGLHVFPISIPIGDMTAVQMRGIAALMYREHLSDLRSTQDQNLMFVGVPEERVAAVREGLADLGLGEPQAGDDVVSCPGTSTCRLGITSSKVIGTRVGGGSMDLRIRASGCHNGCAQPETGDIGIYGEGKRLHGKLVPHYQFYIGGDGRNGGDIAIKGPSVPAARAPRAIERLQAAYAESRSDNETFFAWAHRQAPEYFGELLADIATVSLDELTSVLNDHGQEEAFRVFQFGGGECAGAAQETVAANFAEAANERNYRNGFLMQRKYEESVECSRAIGRLVGQSLLFLAGQPPVEDLREIGGKLAATLNGNQSLGDQLVKLAGTLDRIDSDFDEPTYRELMAELDAWTVAAGAACQDIDRQLDLSASLQSINGGAQAEKKRAGAAL